MKSHLRKDKLLKRIDKSLHDVTAIPVIYHPWGSCNAREAQKVGWHTHSDLAMPKPVNFILIQLGQGRLYKERTSIYKSCM